MSIYATLWTLKFPKDGDEYPGSEWIMVTAQGVPPHIGSPTPGCGYEDGDPYASFLPPPVLYNDDEESDNIMRAVVFVTENTVKGTERSGQEYDNPLVVMTGEDYARATFSDLHTRICDALRGGKPRLVVYGYYPDGVLRLMFEDGSFREINR